MSAERFSLASNPTGNFTLKNPVSLGVNSLFVVAQEERLMTPRDLYIAPLEGDYHIVFNPFAENSSVVVVNSWMLGLLKAFRESRTISDVLLDATKLNIDTPTIEHALLTLHRLSILVSEDWRPHNPSTETDTLAAWLHVTNECNLRCAYCYLNKTSDSMSLETGKRAIDALFRSVQRHDFRALKLKFSGGEATLNFDLVIRLHDYALAKAYETDILVNSVVLSNGVGITRQMAEAILQREMRLMISLDGITKHNDVQRVFANGKGSFKVVSSTIDRLLTVGLIPQISVTITNRNVDGLADLLRYVLGRKLPFSLSFYRDNDCSASIDDLRNSDERLIVGMEAAYKVIEELLPDWSLLGAIVDRANFTQPHSKTCGVGDNYVVIDEHGNIAKCQMAIKDTLGTVDVPDVVALIREDQIGIRNLPVREKVGCRDCTWRNSCTGGCALHTYRITGRYDIKSPNCGIYKAIYPQVLRLEGLRILRQAQQELSDKTRITDGTD